MENLFLFCLKFYYGSVFCGWCYLFIDIVFLMYVFWCFFNDVLVVIVNSFVIYFFLFVYVCGVLICDVFFEMVWKSDIGI